MIGTSMLSCPCRRSEGGGATMWIGHPGRHNMIHWGRNKGGNILLAYGMKSTEKLSHFQVLFGIREIIICLFYLNGTDVSPYHYHGWHVNHHHGPWPLLSTIIVITRHCGNAPLSLAPHTRPSTPATICRIDGDDPPEQVDMLFARICRDDAFSLFTFDNTL